MKESVLDMNQIKRILLRVILSLFCLFYGSAMRAYDFQVDGLYYEIIAGTNEVFIHPANGKIQMKYSGNITIPGTIMDYNGNVYTVVGIGEYAFAGSSITSISFPQTIRFIDEAAFMQCKSLKSINLPNKLESIGKAFISNSGITHIKIPKSVTKIANYAFGPDVNSSGSQLESIDLSELSSAITELPEGLFWTCKLKSINIPSTITTIGKGAFQSCENLEKIVLPSSVVTIKEMAFYGCYSMTTLTIPNSVSSIGNYAFWSCSSLNEVNSEIKNPYSISETVFQLISSNAELYVPKGTKNIYEQFSGWTKHFSEIKEKTVNYTLSITASGNGSASYDGTTVRGKTSSFTVNEGTSATITFTPDNGYRIKSVTVNGSTVSVSNNKYTISSITSNTMVSVEFEAIPPTTYTLSITASGNGSASYNGTTVRGKTTSFTVNEGTSATITFSPDDGYWIKSVKVNSSTVTVSNNKYTISSINANTTVSVEFEAIPPTTYTLSITASGNGSASYDGTTIRDKTSSFTVNEGTSATVIFTPDNGYRIKRVKVGSIDGNAWVITLGTNGNWWVDGKDTGVSCLNKGDAYAITVGANRKWFINNDGKYIISGISESVKIEVEFEAIPPTTFTLSITASGNGSASYNGTTVRGKTSSFTVNEGTSATITFTPDNDYRIKSVLVNTSDATSSVSNNQYTISVIKADVSVEVEFAYSGESLIDEADGIIEQLEEKIKTSRTNLSQLTEIVNNNAIYDESLRSAYLAKIVYYKAELDAIEAKNTAAKAEYYAKKESVNSGTVNENSLLSLISGLKSLASQLDTLISNISNDYEQYSTILNNCFILTIKSTGNGYAYYDGQSIRNNQSTIKVLGGSSATISFTPDNGYRIKSVKVNYMTVTVSNNKYTISNISANTTVSVEFEAIQPTTYTLLITASGNGSASYDGTIVRGKTTSFTVNKGTSATVTFTPDNGYRIKSVKINFLTVSVSNNKYTISDISANTTVNVEFEAIPPTTYTLSITSSGNGSASYDGTTVRDKTSTFTVNEGTSATVTFTPDNGYRIKSVKINFLTVSVSNNKYTISNISANTTVNVEFEAVPPTTYTLSITASGNGSASYDGTTVRGKTSSFTVNEGTSATITFTPDNGYRIKNVKVNNLTVSVTNNKYTISNISANTTVSVEFESITHTLSITSSGNGYTFFGSTTIRNNTNSFTVNDGASATITFAPDTGYRIKSVKVNSSDVTSYVSNNSYTISNINKNYSLEVEFAEDLKSFTSDGINYFVSSYDNKTILVGNGDYGKVLEVPAEVICQNIKWKVDGITDDALTANTELAAIIWKPAVAFTLDVGNPNLLLYVTSANYAPSSITNVIVNNTANKIVLSDAVSGNDFYCPIEFTAKSISYTHNYLMTTGIGESRGWETIALPFDVQKITHSSKGNITPFANWKSGDSMKPFWLKTYGAGGWTDATSIKANTPYIISMPNRSDYKSEFRLNGIITFSSDNVTVKKSDDIQTGSYDRKTFIPSYANKANNSYYALNVNNDYVTYNGSDLEGSRFIIGIRAVYPFEAYMTNSSSSARSISISDDMTTGIEDVDVLVDENKGLRVYNLKGQLIIAEVTQALDDIKKKLPAGVYIVNGKKLIIK